MPETGGVFQGAERRANMLRMTQPPDELEHWCFPLTDPAWVQAAAADHMRPDDPVLGIEDGGGAWALPWWIMKNHHIANVEFNGRPWLVNLCEVCTSAAAFDPVIEGSRHTFRLGGLYNGTIMPVDDQTGSLWTGFTGEAIDGKFTGRVLERRPLLQCTWEEWLAMHPDTLVADGSGESREGHGEGRSPGSPQVEAGMRDLVKNVDPRLPHYTLVLGVAAGGAERCYPLPALADHGPVLNDTLGGQRIVVMHRPGTWMACAFHARLDGRELEFRNDNGAVVDAHSGSRWEVGGEAVEGPLKGRRLEFINSGIEEFYAWAAFHPGTEIWGLEPGAGTGASSLFAVPPVVGRIIQAGWWQRGVKTLDVGCGDGLTAAWMAELGLEVTGIDPDPARIEHARATFRGVTRLEFAAADARAPLQLPGAPFGAVLDTGYFQSLAPAERRGYVDNIAGVAAPGARMLLLVRVPRDKFQARVARIRGLCEGRFRVVDARPVKLTGAAGRPAPGGALRLVRQG